MRRGRHGNSMGVSYELIPRKLIADRRGWLLKLIGGFEHGLPALVGEIYSVHGQLGEPRGNHYHRAAAEWFTLVSGAVRCVLGNPETGERIELRIEFADALTLFIPAMTAHCFCADASSPDPMILIAYSSQRYDRADTIPYELLPEVT